LWRKCNFGGISPFLSEFVRSHVDFPQIESLKSASEYELAAISHERAFTGLNCVRESLGQSPKRMMDDEGGAGLLA